MTTREKLAAAWHELVDCVLDMFLLFAPVVVFVGFVAALAVILRLVDAGPNQ